MQYFDVNNADPEYLNLVKKVMQFGTRKDDRTGTGTVSMFAPGQMRFNLQDGFPLLQLKYTSFSLVFGELMWMMVEGSTSNKELEDKYSVRFWRHWQDEVGELPNIYGKQVTRSEGPRRVVKIKKRTADKEESIDYLKFPLDTPESSDKDDLIGIKFTSASSGDYVVLNRAGSEKQRRTYTIQFLKTGFKKVVTQKVAVTGRVKDSYYPSVRGVGFKGDCVLKTDLDKKVYSMWSRMIDRCYGANANENTYKNVFVCNRWFNFSNFRKDVEFLPNWHKKKYNFEGYELDKDYYGANVYSPDTCVFLNVQDNLLYQKGKSKLFVAVHPNGQKELAISTADFARDNGLRKNSIQRLLASGNPNRKTQGFSFYYEEPEEGYVYRYQLPVNQLQRVIEGIRDNPNSRRLIIDNWSAYDLEHQALPACHAFVQFFVSEGKLSCLMYQRSVDVMLGLPYNIAFYSLLTHMIAHVTGLDVGEFIHDGGDTHIYDNLLDMAEEVMRREPRKSVKLKIKREVKDIRDFKLEDFELIGYDPYPAIKGNVSV